MARCAKPASGSIAEGAGEEAAGTGLGGMGRFCERLSAADSAHWAKRAVDPGSAWGEIESVVTTNAAVQGAIGGIVGTQRAPSCCTLTDAVSPTCMAKGGGLSSRTQTGKRCATTTQLRSRPTTGRPGPP
jgi:hypothetical protein